VLCVDYLFVILPGKFVVISYMQILNHSFRQSASVCWFTVLVIHYTAPQKKTLVKIGNTGNSERGRERVMTKTLPLISYWHFMVIYPVQSTAFWLLSCTVDISLVIWCDDVLQVLETCVKNCGMRFHIYVAQKEFLQELVKLAMPRNNPPHFVLDKVLGLIQVWSHCCIWQCHKHHEP